MKLSTKSPHRNITIILLVLVLTLTSSSMSRAQFTINGVDGASTPEGAFPNGGSPVRGVPGMSRSAPSTLNL